MKNAECNGKNDEVRKGRNVGTVIAAKWPSVSVVQGRLARQINNGIIDANIADIKIGERFRKDMGDIEALAKSIEEVDFFQPIGIAEDYRLVFGERRLRAYRDVLGRKTIPARIVPVKSLFLAEIAENTVRKEYTISERVAIADALRGYTHGGDRRSEQARKCDVEALTVDEAAKRAGFGSQDTYLRAHSVIQHGIPELVEAMDSGKFSIAAAAAIAKLPPEDQKESVCRGKLSIACSPNDPRPTSSAGAKDDHGNCPKPRSTENGCPQAPVAKQTCSPDMLYRHMKQAAKDVESIDWQPDTISSFEVDEILRFCEHVAQVIAERRKTLGQPQKVDTTPYLAELEVL